MHQIDADPKPIEYWAEKWGVHPRTIDRWIKEGTCPCLNIGGRRMISCLQLLNWEQPTEVVMPAQTSTRIDTERHKPTPPHAPSLRAPKLNNRGVRRTKES